MRGDRIQRLGLRGRMSVRLIINGETRELPVHTVADVTKTLGYEGDYFAVALNVNCVPRTRYADTPVQDGDAIEILTPMQGG